MYVSQCNIFYSSVLQLDISEVTSSDCLRTFKTKLKTLVFFIFPTVDCKVTAVPLAFSL